MFKFITALMVCIVSGTLIAVEDEMTVRLNTDAQLIPIYLAKSTEDHSGLSPGYIKQLEDVLQFDLNHNGMTSTVSQSSEKERIIQRDLRVSDQKLLEAFYVVQMQLTSEHKLHATLRALNGSLAKSLDGGVIQGNLNQDRTQIHQLADTIYKLLFNQEGIASTHILYTVRRKADKDWISEVWEADYDGENARKVLSEAGYVITPVYFPPKSGHRSGNIFYVSYKGSQPKIYAASLKGGQGHRAITLRGNQLMPSVNYQRDQLAFISDVTGNPDLFLQELSAESGPQGKPQQIFAAHKATQGSPTFSPDGKKLAFVSNKDGSPRIYMINTPKPGTPLKDVQAKLITRNSKESSAPSWSPDGKKLAYCAMTQGVRQIWVYDFATAEERQLTQGPGNKENPSWAPNSLSLVYNTNEHTSSELYLVSLNQPRSVRITSGPGEKRFPNWEPRL